MKKTSIIAIGVLNILTTWTAVAQSSFWLNNYDPSNVDAPVLDAQGTPLEGPNYVAELWGGATPDSLTPAVTLLTGRRLIIPFFTGGNAGYFRDPDQRRDGDDLVVLQVLPRTFAWLEVRAWDVRLGATYEAVASLGIGGYGVSPEFYAQGGDPFDQFPVPGRLIGLQSFNLLPVVPEPSTLALLALGGLAFCWARRRGRS